MRRLLFVSLFSFSLLSFSQKKGDLSLGLGIGFEYGGIGLNTTYLPHNQIGLFGGVGTVFGDLGYDVGVKYLFPSKWKQTLFVEAMYGYNSGIRIENYYAPGEDFDKNYYGPSIGMGMLFNTKKDKIFWTFSLIFPFRSSEFEEDFDMLNSDPNIDLNVLPISISFGINFRLFSK